MGIKTSLILVSIVLLVVIHLVTVIFSLNGVSIYNNNNNNNNNNKRHDYEYNGQRSSHILYNSEVGLGSSSEVKQELDKQTPVQHSASNEPTKRSDNSLDQYQNVNQTRSFPKLVSYPHLLFNYSNIPPVRMRPKLQAMIDKALALPIDKPVGLRHEANPSGTNVVMGLAAYPKSMNTFRLLVGSLRHTGFDGHIILGVHKDIPQDEEDYLKNMQVTYYVVEFIDCDPSIMEGGKSDVLIRGKCSPGLERLKLEWGRFEMCRQWLHACQTCTGWTLVMDTRDAFFQADPFLNLPSAQDTSTENLLFVEEIAPHSNPLPLSPHRADTIGSSPFYKSSTMRCYGRNHYRSYADRPVLCSGTIMGTKEGMHRFLSVLVDEFYRNNHVTSNIQCRSPRNTDQTTMNMLYYTGRFGEFNRTKTLPYGTGPVHTIGTPCVNRNLPTGQEHSQKDMIVFDNQNRILNIHEPESSKARIAPCIHQYDRCHKWINAWLKSHHHFT